MQMKNPLHPGRIVKSELDELGVTIVAAAVALGVTRQQLHNLISGRCGIVPEMALRLEKGLGSTADAWLRMQANYDLAQARQNGKPLKVTPLVPA